MKNGICDDSLRVVMVLDCLPAEGGGGGGPGPQPIRRHTYPPQHNAELQP